MKNLFLIDGAAGTGKTDFFNFINQVGTQTYGLAIALPKFSTRKGERPVISDFPPDIILKSEEDFVVAAKEIRKAGKKFYEYQYQTAKYGIAKETIDRALKEHSNVYIIIRSSYCIKEICDDYKEYHNINLVPILIYSDIEHVRRRLVAEGNTEQQIKDRLSRTNIFLEDFYTQPENIYKEIVLNNSVKEVFYRQMRTIFEKHNQHHNYGNKPKAFIIMPMSKEDTGYTQIKNKIIEGAEEAGFIAERADDIFDSSRKLIMTKVYDAIRSADVCIVDLSAERPNCYLELGYAHALNKPIIGIIQKDENLHFDEIGYDYYRYIDDANGLKKLKQKLSTNLSDWKLRYYL